MLTFTVVQHEHFTKIYDAQEHIGFQGCVCECVCVCVCVWYKGLLLFLSEHPLIGHCAIPPFFFPSPLFAPGLFEFQVSGVEDGPTTRSGAEEGFFCYHVSSQTDVNLRKEGERERESERERERWSAAGSEGGGERKKRPRYAPDSSAAPSPSYLAPLPFSFFFPSFCVC